MDVQAARPFPLFARPFPLYTTRLIVALLFRRSRVQIRGPKPTRSSPDVNSGPNGPSMIHSILVPTCTSIFSSVEKYPFLQRRFVQARSQFCDPNESPSLIPLESAEREAREAREPTERDERGASSHIGLNSVLLPIASYTSQ